MTSIDLTNEFIFDIIHKAEQGSQLPGQGKGFPCRGSSRGYSVPLVWISSMPFILGNYVYLCRTENNLSLQFPSLLGGGS